MISYNGRSTNDDATCFINTKALWYSETLLEVLSGKWRQIKPMQTKGIFFEMFYRGPIFGGSKKESPSEKSVFVIIGKNLNVRD